MFGTDLFQAYEQGDTNKPHNMVHADPPNQEIEMNLPAVQQLPKEDTIYETNQFYKDQQMQIQLHQLQEELKIQKQQKHSNESSIIDRFVNKKKEVLKLVSISLTILLAFSLHYLVNDLMKAYFMNNVLTSTQELTTKVAYPISVLLLLWTIKVFNK